jgi:hypothetical protein
MVGAIEAWSTLVRVTTIMWTGTSSTNIVVHTLCLQSWLSPRPSLHHCLDEDAPTSTVLHEPQHRHRPQPCLTMMSPPWLQKCHPYAGLCDKDTQPLVLQHRCHYFPSTVVGSLWHPGASKRHLMSGASHNLWSISVVDAAVLRGTCGAQENSYPIPSFLKTNTCSALVRPFACAFWEEEPRSARACGYPGDVYMSVVNGLYVRGGVPPWLVAPIEHPPGVVKANGRG